MDGQSLHTNVLQALGHLVYIDRVFVPTQTRFYGNRQIGAFNHGLGESHHQIDVFENRSSGAFAHYFFYRTTKIDVDDIGFYGSHNFGW